VGCEKFVGLSPWLSSHNPKNHKPTNHPNHCLAVITTNLQYRYIQWKILEGHEGIQIQWAVCLAAGWFGLWDIPVGMLYYTLYFRAIIQITTAYVFVFERVRWRHFWYRCLPHTVSLGHGSMNTQVSEPAVHNTHTIAWQPFTTCYLDTSNGGWFHMVMKGINGLYLAVHHRLVFMLRAVVNYVYICHIPF
jgi:hypothetical protein